MFILNLAKEDLVYRNHGEVLVLKEGLNLVTNTLCTAEEIKNHFGDYVSIITDNDEKEVKTEDPEMNLVEEVVEIAEEETEAVEEPEVEEKCKPCYAEGKTPNEDDCKACKEEAKEEVKAEDKKETKKQSKSKKGSSKKNK